MKKILYLTITVLLQIGVCNIIHGNTNITNSNSRYHLLSMSQAFPLQNGISIEHKELIEKLSKDKDFIKFYKYSIAGSLQKGLVENKIKNNVEVPNEDKLLLEEITNKSEGIYEKVLNKFPDFKSLDINEKVNVMRESFAIVASLSFNELSDCFSAYSNNLKTCKILSKLESAVFLSCGILAFAADILVIVESAGSAASIVGTLVWSQISLCAQIAGGINFATCAKDLVGGLVNCIKAQAGD